MKVASVFPSDFWWESIYAYFTERSYCFKMLQLSSCLHSCLLLFSLCFSSILHARHHSSQQVCRHRITGQQLSEHPAADTGRNLGRNDAQKLTQLPRLDCDYRSNSRNLLTHWLHAKVVLIPFLPETCCWVSTTSPLTPSHSASSVCICISVFYRACVVYHMCSTV